jgi:hypothetical protein
MKKGKNKSSQTMEDIEDVLQEEIDKLREGNKQQKEGRR